MQPVKKMDECVHKMIHFAFVAEIINEFTIIVGFSPRVFSDINARDASERREDFTGKSQLLLSDSNQDWNEAINCSETNKHRIL